MITSMCITTAKIDQSLDAFYGFGIFVNKKLFYTILYSPKKKKKQLKPSGIVILISHDFSYFFEICIRSC